MISLMKITGTMPLWALLVLVVLLSCGISWALVALVRWRFPHPYFVENNEFLGFTFAVYGLIYGVVLAFTIVTAWERFNETEYIVSKETTVVSELWRDAGAFPHESRAEIHRDLKAYVMSVVDKEWKTLAEKGKLSPETETIYGHLWTHSYNIRPSTSNEEAFLKEFVARINELSGLRRQRLLHSHDEVNGMLWLVLLAGAFPTFIYSLLFATKHAWVHVAVTSFLTGLIILCLLVTFSWQYPFSGSVAVKSEPFMELKLAIEQRESADTMEAPPVSIGRIRR